MKKEVLDLFSYEYDTYLPTLAQLRPGRKLPLGATSIDFVIIGRSFFRKDFLPSRPTRLCFLLAAVVAVVAVCPTHKLGDIGISCSSHCRLGSQCRHELGEDFSLLWITFWEDGRS